MHNLLTKQEIQLLSLIEYLYDSKEKVPMSPGFLKNVRNYSWI